MSIWSPIIKDPAAFCPPPSAKAKSSERTSNRSLPIARTRTSRQLCRETCPDRRRESKAAAKSPAIAPRPLVSPRGVRNSASSCKRSPMGSPQSNRDVNSVSKADIAARSWVRSSGTVGKDICSGDPRCDDSHASSICRESLPSAPFRRDCAAGPARTRFSWAP
jgi:hypothetical protein